MFFFRNLATNWKNFVINCNDMVCKYKDLKVNCKNFRIGLKNPIYRLKKVEKDETSFILRKGWLGKRLVEAGVGFLGFCEQIAAVCV